MENNYNSNSNSNSDPGTEQSSGSLYSYSYIKQEKPAEDSNNEAQSSSYSEAPTNSYQEVPTNSYNGAQYTNYSEAPTSSYQEASTSSYQEAPTSSYQEAPTSSYQEASTSSYQEASTSSHSETPVSSYQEAPGSGDYGVPAGNDGGGANSHYYSAGSGGSGNNGIEPNPEPKKKKKEKKPKIKGKHGFGATLGKCAALALVFGMVSGTVFYGAGHVMDYAIGSDTTQNPQKLTTNSSEQSGGNISTTSTGNENVLSDVSAVVENVMPSIVSITNLSQRQYEDFFGQVYNEEIPSAGSGIIIAQTDKELYIVTNNHVVDGADTLTVSFVDDQTATAEIKGTDASTDLAVISVPLDNVSADTLSKIKVATLGNSDDTKVGEAAIAIGNALGYGQSVTTGVISAVNREVSVMDTNNETITNSLLQTDAAINPGNSGGALLNIKGEVIGINSVKYSDTDVEGMGYAIPISTAEPIINDLITREVVDETQTAFLGVSGVDVTSEVTQKYQMPTGIYVVQVTAGSAAEKAGIKQGDILTSFDGKSVDSMTELASNMQYYAAGTTVEVKIMRAQEGAYEESTISVTLGKKN